MRTKSPKVSRFCKDLSRICTTFPGRAWGRSVGDLPPVRYMLHYFGPIRGLQLIATVDSRMPVHEDLGEKLLTQAEWEEKTGRRPWQAPATMPTWQGPLTEDQLPNGNGKAKPSKAKLRAELESLLPSLPAGKVLKQFIATATPTGVRKMPGVLRLQQPWPSKTGLWHY